MHGSLLMHGTRIYETDKPASILFDIETIELRVRWLLYGLKLLLPVQIMHEHMKQIGHAH